MTGGKQTLAAALLLAALLAGGCAPAEPAAPSAVSTAPSASDSSGDAGDPEGGGLEEETPNFERITDPYDLCVFMNLCCADFDFENPADLADEKLFTLGMWIISGDALYADQWDAWFAEPGRRAKVPAAAVRGALEKRVAGMKPEFFDPTGLPEYDAATDTLRADIGGYGGGRNPRLRSREEADGVVTLVIDYRDMDSENVYESRVYRLEVGGPGEWKLLSALPTGELPERSDLGWEH